MASFTYDTVHLSSDALFLVGLSFDLVSESEFERRKVRAPHPFHIASGPQQHSTNLSRSPVFCDGLSCFCSSFMLLVVWVGPADATLLEKYPASQDILVFESFTVFCRKLQIYVHSCALEEARISVSARDCLGEGSNFASRFDLEVSFSKLDFGTVFRVTPGFSMFDDD